MVFVTETKREKPILKMQGTYNFVLFCALQGDIASKLKQKILIVEN